MFKPNLSSEPKDPITFPKLGSPKLDGIRCVTHEGGVLSRSLLPIPNLHVREVLKDYQNLDGELIHGSPTAPNVYHATNSAVMTRAGQPQFTYYVFDLLNDSRPFAEKLETLRSMQFPDFIQVLPQTIIHTKEQLDAFYADLTTQGYEGAMLRNPNAVYKYGRSTAKSQDLLKLKPFLDSEAVVISVYEAMYNGNEAVTNLLGRTERSTHKENLEGKGMLGGFCVRDIHTGVEFDCAPGKSTHYERTEWWNNQPIGKVLKYRYLPVGVKDKPRHCRFIGWRSAEDM